VGQGEGPAILQRAAALELGKHHHSLHQLLQVKEPWGLPEPAAAVKKADYSEVCLQNEVCVERKGAKEAWQVG
jgi:hypothetical protein